MIFPVIELVDRYVIAKLKHIKTGGANQTEYDFYHKQFVLGEYNLDLVTDEIQNLYNIHNNIWMLEAELKSGREAELSLEELGLRAIKIRDLNNQRIKLKNTIADKLGCQVKEIKKDHLSE